MKGVIPTGLTSIAPAHRGSEKLQSIFVISALISGSGETEIDIVNKGPGQPSVHGVTSNTAVSTALNNGLTLSNVPESNALGAPAPCG